MCVCVCVCVCVGGWGGVRSVSGYVWRGCVAVRIVLLGPTVALQKWLAPPIGSNMYVRMIRELMTMLFPGGAASGHCVHCGSVYVQDRGHREEETL